VREHMVTWIQRNHPDALPVTRVSLDPPGERATDTL
jgi:hypothetical protein